MRRVHVRAGDIQPGDVILTSIWPPHSRVTVTAVFENDDASVSVVYDGGSIDCDPDLLLAVVSLTGMAA